MFKPPYRAPTNLDALSGRETNRLIRNNDIASLAETRNHTRDSRERLRIDNASGHTKVRSNIRLRLLVDILGPVEAWGTARADTIGTECLDGFLFEDFGGEEVVEVVRGEVRYGSAV